MHNNTTDARVIIPQDPVIGNFDEENIIDDDLNMHGFEVKNIKLSNDPNSATSNQRVYDIMNTFQNNLTLTTDKLIVNNNLDFGANYMPKSSKVPTVNEDLTNKYYVDNKTFGNTNFNDNTINGSRLLNGSVSNSKISTNAIGTSKIADAQITTEKLVDLSITTEKLDDLAVTNDKINSVDFSKVTNVPTSFPTKTSTLTVDSDVDFGPRYLSTTNTTFTNADQIVNKGYVDTQITNISFPTMPTSLPIGSIVMWAISTIPSDWLVCNGQSVNQSLYPDLYTLMTDVPDLRGCFVRGLDSGKGYDSGRQLGSYQADTFKSHTHSMSSEGSHDHMTALAVGDDGSFGHTSALYPEAISGNPNFTSSVAITDVKGDHTHTINSTGSTETRPKNVALIYIIKAK